MIEGYPSVGPKWPRRDRRSSRGISKTRTPDSSPAKCFRSDGLHAQNDAEAHRASKSGSPPANRSVPRGYDQTALVRHPFRPVPKPLPENDLTQSGAYRVLFHQPVQTMTDPPRPAGEPRADQSIPRRPHPAPDAPVHYTTNGHDPVGFVKEANPRHGFPKSPKPPDGPAIPR